ncbi:hypothetical protein BDF14DRAFT_1858594 [Spinellus fusiger]|nr:hypothetical protein BDF14DRAFT_1858594 [Spinellus fusiger]
MEHRLWQYMSQKQTDWDFIAGQLGVPASYVVRQAAFIYETQLRGLHQQLRLGEVGKGEVGKGGGGGQTTCTSRPTSRPTSRRQATPVHSIMQGSTGDTEELGDSRRSLTTATAHGSMMLSTLSNIIPRKDASREQIKTEKSFLVESVYKSFATSQNNRSLYASSPSRGEFIATEQSEISKEEHIEKDGKGKGKEMPTEAVGSMDSVDSMDSINSQQEQKQEKQKRIGLSEEEEKEEEKDSESEQDSEEGDEAMSHHFEQMRLQLEPAFLPLHKSRSNLLLPRPAPTPPTPPTPTTPHQTHPPASGSHTETETEQHKYTSPSDHSNKSTGTVNSVGSSFSDLSGKSTGNPWP